MLALLTALFGGGAQIASAVMGAQASNEATAENARANRENVRLREREREEAIKASEELKAEQHLGGYDAYGNRTYFDPNKGWVVELAPNVKAARDNYLNEQLPALQQLFRRNIARGREEELIADTLRRQFKDIERPSRSSIEALLFDAANQAIGPETADQQRTALRTAVRTGNNSNIPKIVEAISAADGNKRADALIKARLAARDQADNEFSGQRGSTAQLYNLFAGRAGAVPNTPQGQGEGQAVANQLLQMFSGLAQSGNSALINALGRQGGTWDKTDPNYGPANAMSSIGSTISSIGDSVSGSNERSNLQKILQQYLSSGGQYADLFGDMYSSDRLRSSQGVF